MWAVPRGMKEDPHEDPPMMLVGPVRPRVLQWHLTASTATRGRQCQGSGTAMLDTPPALSLATAGHTTWGTHCNTGTWVSSGLGWRQAEIFFLLNLLFFLFPLLAPPCPICLQS